MSLEYCHDCDKMIDLDTDCEHECFNKPLGDKIHKKDTSLGGYLIVKDVREAVKKLREFLLSQSVAMIGDEESNVYLRDSLSIYKNDMNEKIKEIFGEDLV